MRRRKRTTATAGESIPHRTVLHCSEQTISYLTATIPAVYSRIAGAQLPYDRPQNAAIHGDCRDPQNEALQLSILAPRQPRRGSTPRAKRRPAPLSLRPEPPRTARAKHRSEPACLRAAKPRTANLHRSFSTGNRRHAPSRMSTATIRTTSATASVAAADRRLLPVVAASWPRRTFRNPSRSATRPSARGSCMTDGKRALRAAAIAAAQNSPTLTKDQVVVTSTS